MSFYGGALPFQIRIIEARNIKRADITRSSDPYVEVKLKGHLKTIYKTRVAHRDLYPIWNETFSFMPSNPQSDIVTLKLWDHDTLTPDDFLGKISIPVRQYINRGPVEEWIILTNNKGNRFTQGELHIEVQYGNFQGASVPGMYPQPQMTAQPSPYQPQMPPPFNPQAMAPQYPAQAYPPAAQQYMPQPYPPAAPQQYVPPQQYAQNPMQYAPAPYPPSPLPPAQMPPGQAYPPQYGTGYPQPQQMPQRPQQGSGISGLVGTASQLLNTLNRYH